MNTITYIYSRFFKNKDKVLIFHFKLSFQLINLTSSNTNYSNLKRIRSKKRSYSLVRSKRLVTAVGKGPTIETA